MNNSNGLSIVFGEAASRRIEQCGIDKSHIQSVADDVYDMILKNKDTGHFSLRLWGELVALHVLGDTDITSIFQEFAYLEGLTPISNTKPEGQFKGSILHPLWHKHYFQAQFIPNNILNEMKRDNTVERVLGPHDGQIITKEMMHDLVHEIVSGNLERRDDDGRLTGEWIVYLIDNGKKYYLTLARHDEDDQVIRDRVEEYVKDGRYL